MPTSQNWFPDGKGIIYSRVTSSPNLVRRNLITGEEDLLLPRRTFQQATDISRSGRELAFIERGPDGGFHAWTLALEGARQPKPLFKPDSRQEDVRFSPDGSFVAYRSDESGDWEAYVVSLANPSAKVRITQKGASHLRWRRDGAEILVLSGDGRMIGVPVRTVPDLQVDKAVTLFTLPEGVSWYDFDVTSDGQRFLAVESVQTAGLDSEGIPLMPLRRSVCSRLSSRDRECLLQKSHELSCGSGPFCAIDRKTPGKE
jgi:Tol biopolymer transport system component